MGNILYYGDNLDILRERIGTESVDLIYLDPPFNSNRSYNVLFGTDRGEDAQAQIEAFDDTWTWTPETDRLYFELIGGGAPSNVADALQAMHGLLSEGDVMAYLVMMAGRLVQLHRVLKPTGSIYLHCDPTASHHLKVLMDAVFGPTNFRNEIIWKRTSGHSDAVRFGRVHDVILFFSKTNQPTWNTIFQEYDQAYVDQYYRYEDPDGRRFMSADLGAAGLTGGGYDYDWKGIRRVWRAPIETMERLDQEGRLFYTRNGIPRLKRYLDEAKGLPGQDVWTDIEALRSWHQEKLGFPTQKPMKLLERIVEASSDPGDLVLDPFCGCGTAVVAAEKLGRKWIGIDIAYIAVDLIRRRLQDVFGTRADFEVDGIPRDVAGAQALFARSDFEFERWAVSLVWGQPKEHPGGDLGIDGVIRFPIGAKNQVGRVLVSVKGGRQLNPAFVRDLRGTVERERAEMGVLITLAEPTRGMIQEANHAGNYVWPVNSSPFPKIQVATIPQLLDGYRLSMPTALMPYVQAPRHVEEPDQLILDNGGA